MSIAVSDSSRRDKIYILSFISSVFFVCLFFLIAHCDFPNRKRHTSRMVCPTQTLTRQFQLCVCVCCARAFVPLCFVVSISSFGFFEIRAFATRGRLSRLHLLEKMEKMIETITPHRNLIRMRSVGRNGENNFTCPNLSYGNVSIICVQFRMGKRNFV